MLFLSKLKRLKKSSRSFSQPKMRRGKHTGRLVTISSCKEIQLLTLSGCNARKRGYLRERQSARRLSKIEKALSRTCHIPS